MGAREDILRAVRAAHVEAEPPPVVRARSPAEGDPAELFAAMLREAGGTVLRAARAELRSAVAALPSYASARRVLSFLPEVLPSGAPSASGDPRALADVDFALFRADFGVAENGAVWVTDRLVAPRAAFFLPEHVAVVVEARDLVPDMHAAYARLAGTPPAFGCFVAGPSKTADIEQALVIGAHGPRSLVAILVDAS